MPRLTAKNHILYYATAGNAINPPLLLLHGFLGSHLDFAAILPALCEHFYCITPDFPGHGQTLTAPGSYTFSATAKTLLSLLDYLGIARTHLLGYSMGGRLALYLACCFSERFSRVVLESASPGLKTAAARQQRVKKDEAIAHQIETIPLSTFLAQWYSNPLFDSLNNHLDGYNAMRQRRQHNSATELAQALRGFSTGRQRPLWSALPNLETPLLLLAGALDDKFVALNREMAQVGKAAPITLRIVANYGHNLHLETPDAYTQAVIQFLPHLTR